ncbi:unnamed protein product [Protopolystoma xenopodis]|uniref:Helicase ATP-binding domain-containing protein n=1 Tax=Protopolystoma xenopodis TaxID=117903 RepID=A0A448WMS9_9PLAT|nr:unnamed protein product [Protopolystoma xenopodis]
MYLLFDMSIPFGLDLDNLPSFFNAADEPVPDTKVNLSDDFNFKQSTNTLVENKRKAEESLKGYINDYMLTSPKIPKSSKDDTIPEFEAPCIKIHKVQTSGDCTHEVAVPPFLEYTELTPSSRPPAKVFEFKLDTFQQQAILCIDNNQSVMVSAHTSAGKTLVAEYAIASALRERQRVIFTTPIKALSNQKFREFSEQFMEVGLLTGDATINPNASVLIMTTEILQSMLYRGSSIVREVGWVIFDEIHYMRDLERGVVWEEAIVLLPDCIKLVFLSATIRNARQFAEWTAHLHKQPCHVVTSDRRPVPLCHYLYPRGGQGLFLIIEQGKFHEDNFMHAMRSFSADEIGASLSRKGAENSVVQIVQLVKHRSLEPVIVFSFSKKECEIYALQLAQISFLTAVPKFQIVQLAFIPFTITRSCLPHKLFRVYNFSNSEILV